MESDKDNKNNKIAIQKHILDGLALKGKPLNSNQVRTLCKICAFSVNKKQDEKYCVYRYFHPLVRAGIIECFHSDENPVLQSSKTLRWIFSPPAVFFRDFPDKKKRRWIGFNLTYDMFDKIPSEYDILNENDPLYDYIVQWETPVLYTGEGLPVRQNPSALDLLKSMPCCSFECFAKEEMFDIGNFSQVYNPETREWMDKQNCNSLISGFYRKNSEPYSLRIYYSCSSGKTFVLTYNPDSDQWARLMHCVDNNHPIAEYDEKEKTIVFFQSLPFLLGRILFYNQMFSNCGFEDWRQTELSSDGKYYNVTPEMVGQLKRIFGKTLIKTKGTEL